VESTSSDDPTASLEYEKDVRTVAPEQNYRKRRVKVGWNDAVDGAELNQEVLEELT
jgi:hypothetical protein